MGPLARWAAKKLARREPGRMRNGVAFCVMPAFHLEHDPFGVDQFADKMDFLDNEDFNPVYLRISRHTEHWSSFQPLMLTPVTVRGSRAKFVALG